eukprot:COSAG01_NODE_24737_length_768_cov_1.461883_1_plen_24_part_10
MTYVEQAPKIVALGVLAALWHSGA